MHELFAQVLSAKDLSKAGELFSLEDNEIERDLDEIIKRIEEIADTEEYEKNDNDQSVVEICITRITTAIRETEKIERHAVSLVSLLSMCLRHNLSQGPRDEDPPHAKIASDVMSRLFSYYSNSGVMSLAIPAVVNFLGCSNRDLVRSVASYLSLATIDNGHLLAQHMTVVLDTVLKGNYLLGQVLPQIYDLNPAPVLEHVDELAKLVQTCDSTEKVCFIQLFNKVAKAHPKLLEKHVPQLCTYLSSSLLSSLVLMILVDMAMSRPAAVVSQLTTIQAAVETQPMFMYQVAQIMGAVGTLNKEEAERSMAYLVSHLSNTDQSVLPSVLQEMRALGLTWPDLLQEHLDQISKLSSSGSSAVRLMVQQIREDLRKHCQEERSSHSAAGDTSTSLSSSRNSSSSVAEEAERIRGRKRRERRDVTKDSKDQHNTSNTTTDSSSSTVTSHVSRDKRWSQGGGAEKKKEVRSVSSQTEGTVTVITVGNPPNATHPSGTVSVKSTSVTDNGELNPQNFPPRHSRAIEHSSHSDIHKRTSTHISVATGTENAHGPESMRDGVQLFCEKHLAKIKAFINNISTVVPLPAKCSVVNGKHKRYMQLHFDCACQGEQCLYVGSQFTLPTRLPKLWVHLMFLAVQAKSKCALSQRDIDVSCLKACWDALRSETPSSFLALVTSSFPSQKDQLALLQELHQSRYFDVFELSPARSRWACFVCTHPEKLNQLLTDGSPEIAGQLKEKKGKWMFFKRWKTRYFTLSGGSISYNKSNATKASLPVTKIQSVKAVRKGIRDIPRAFEIFTGDQTYMFKAKSHQSVEQWVQCLHIAVARSHSGGGSGSVGTGSDRASGIEEGNGARGRTSLMQERDTVGNAIEGEQSGFESSIQEDVRLSYGNKGRDNGGRREVNSIGGASGGAGASSAPFGGAEERRSRRGVRRGISNSGAACNISKAFDVHDDENSLSGYSASINEEGAGGGNPTASAGIASEEFFRRSSVRRSSGAGSVGGRSVGSSMVRGAQHGSRRSSERSGRAYAGLLQEGSLHSASPASSVGVNGGVIVAKTVTDTKL